MNHWSDKTTSIEDGIESLKQLVNLRDQMGGAMYWNILNADCCELANILQKRGADREVISEILGKNTHR